ncbi:acyl carrier protein [Kitasatospora sp. NPDC018058]|uniref:acyl carrier protein n=1 Tax=Kitasatospora sp. NPDC018058 TaxID=3364025 RepID=UPI0037BFCD0F
MTTTPQARIDQSVIDYLAQYSPGPVPGLDEDLFATGRVNSLFAMQLLTFLEKTFRITLTADDLDLRNFATVGKITAFVLRKQTTEA